MVFCFLFFFSFQFAFLFKLGNISMGQEQFGEHSRERQSGSSPGREQGEGGRAQGKRRLEVCLLSQEDRAPWEGKNEHLMWLCVTLTPPHPPHQVFSSRKYYQVRVCCILLPCPPPTLPPI